MSSEDQYPSQVHMRPRAIADIEKHAAYLEENAPPDVAQRFRVAIMSAVDHITRHPSSGSVRNTSNPLLVNLRMWIVPDFRQYLVFYLTPEGAVEIVRVFHGAQDVADILANGEEDL